MEGKSERQPAQILDFIVIDARITTR